jgi:hypothetical protein
MLFGNKKNPADEANKFISQIPGQTMQYLYPYSAYGQNALPRLQGQYDEILGNPGGKLNQIGESFHQSPGFQFALQQALQGAGHAAAAGGMAGSPEHEQRNMELGTNLANQDYYNYLKGATGLYGQGLQGEQGLASGGLTAGQSLADTIAQTLAQQGNYAYEGQAGKNQANNSLWSSLGSGLGLLGAFLPWS